MSTKQPITINNAKATYRTTKGTTDDEKKDISIFPHIWHLTQVTDIPDNKRTHLSQSLKAPLMQTEIDQSLLSLDWVFEELCTLNRIWCLKMFY